MIEWTGPNTGKLRRALLSFYPEEWQLQQFVSDNFDFSLAGVGGDSAEQWAGNLLIEFAARGSIEQLYQTFCLVHPNDPRIIQLRQALNDPALERLISGNAVVRQEVAAELLEDPSSTHLVIAVFWQERNKQKLLIRPKFYYRDSVNFAILQESLVKDDCSIVLKDFPCLLRQLVDFTINNKLSSYFADSIHPWKLNIELFLPVDLLCKPLSIWCGEYDDLWKTRSIVVGCSDRFDPDRATAALDLYNQLKLGWQRFHKKVPDLESSKLKNLDWLDSTAACAESLQDYSGFKCYGDWLKSEEEFLQNWLELVKSGIPLALWMYEGNPQCPTTKKVFDDLTNCTRFESIDRLPIVRDRQRKFNNSCVGVFYENLDYAPDKPLPPQEQLFVWTGT